MIAYDFAKANLIAVYYSNPAVNLSNFIFIRFHELRQGLTGEAYVPFFN